jgi:plastocyanin
MLRTVLALTLAGALVLPLGATAASQDYILVIKNHRFEPSEITIPAGQKIKLVVDNQDPTPEEFESHSMNREKVISGRSKASIWIGPHKPGSYDFVGEYHEDTARGKVIAK